MAVNKERLVKVRALINLKYDKVVKKTGEELEIRESDIEELTKRKIVEAIVEA